MVTWWRLKYISVHAIHGEVSAASLANFTRHSTCSAIELPQMRTELKLLVAELSWLHFARCQLDLAKTQGGLKKTAPFNMGKAIHICLSKSASPAFMLRHRPVSQCVCSSAGPLGNHSRSLQTIREYVSLSPCGHKRHFWFSGLLGLTLASYIYVYGNTKL